MKKFIFLIVCVLIVSTATFSVFADGEKQNVTKYGENSEYGEIYGDARNQQAGDNSKWLTLKGGEMGIRIVGDGDKEIVAVDKFGGIYLNGEVYMNDEKVDLNSGKEHDFNFANGFIYFLVILSLLFNAYCVFKIRKK